MTDETKKPKKPRRPASEIAAEKKAWLAKHEWGGARDALELLKSAAQQCEDAQAAVASKVTVEWAGLHNALKAIIARIETTIPPEAR